MESNLKLGFVTCVKLGLSCMEEIYKNGYQLEIIVTLKDEIGKNKSGRIYVDEFAKKNSIQVLKIKNVNEAVVINKLKELKIDWLFIIGWSQIAKKEILDAPNFGVIGMHPTLLPKGRGRASIPWAIIKGLSKTGVSAFKLDEGVDTGPIVDQIEIELNDDETATTLYSKVNDTHIALMKSVLEKIHNANFNMITQNDAEATEWSGRKPEDGELNFEMSVEEVDRLVRATTHPYPGAFIFEKDKKRVIWKGKIVETKINHVGEDNFLKFKDGYYEIVEYTDVDID